MRVSQIRSLFWVGNLVVLAGMGFVVKDFVGTLRTKGQIPEVEWPKSGPATGPMQRWPPGLPKFQQVWKTFVNGKVPPPPEVVKPVEAKKDPAAEFKAKFKYVSGLEFLDEPSRSNVQCTWSAQERTINLGESLDGWQLVSFRKRVLAPAKPDGDARWYDELRFRHDGEGLDLTINGPEYTDKLTGGPVQHVKEYGANLRQGAVEKDRIPAQAYLDPATDEWQVTQDEVDWWTEFGEEALANTGTRPHVDAEGVSHGLKFTTPLGGSTKALQGNTRGVQAEDVLKSVNGVPIGSKEDLVRYLRGDGRDLVRYEAVFENAGKERTVVYRRPRRSSP